MSTPSEIHEAESVIEAWLRKEYFPEIHGKLDAFKLPKEIFQAKRIIGWDRFKELFEKVQRQLQLCA